MSAKKYVDLQNVRLSYDPKENVIRLISTDTRFNGEQFSIRLTAKTKTSDLAQELLHQEEAIDEETYKILLQKSGMNVFNADHSSVLVSSSTSNDFSESSIDPFLALDNLSAPDDIEKVLSEHPLSISIGLDERDRKPVYFAADDLIRNNKNGNLLVIEGNGKAASDTVDDFMTHVADQILNSDHFYDIYTNRGDFFLNSSAGIPKMLLHHISLIKPYPIWDKEGLNEAGVRKQKIFILDHRGYAEHGVAASNTMYLLRSARASGSIVILVTNPISTWKGAYSELVTFGSLTRKDKLVLGLPDDMKHQDGYNSFYQDSNNALHAVRPFGLLRATAR